MGSQRTGFQYDNEDKRLDVKVEGSLAASFVGGTGESDGGRITEHLTVVDDDSQNMTIAVADIVAGINVHTSATGAGTATVDTAVNIIAGVPLTADNQAVVSYFVNDGTQTVTLTAATGTTVADAGQTIGANESAVLLWLRTSSTTVTVYHIGA